MFGSISLFLIGQLLNEMNPDPYNYSNDYEFTGTLDGVDCTGTGTTTYYRENDNYHLYQLEVKISNSVRSEVKYVPMIFELDDRMIDLFEYIGKETIEGIETSVYEQYREGIDYTFYIGEMCELIRVDMVSKDLNVIGLIVEKS